jgi:hypothetical protein
VSCAVAHPLRESSAHRKRMADSHLASHACKQPVT